VSVRLRAPSTTPEPVGRPARPASARVRAAVLIPLAVLAVATGLRTWRLSFPDQTIADEAYYAGDAENYLGGGVAYTPPAFRTIPQENTWVHPPLGKELIALGVGPLGGRPIGWRLPAAVAGIAGVFLVYLLGLSLWRSPGWAGLAALLVAVDGLHIVMSRLAMLDIFLSAFVTAGFLFVVRALAEGDHPGAWDERFGGRDLLLAGSMFGCAIATKWSGAFPLLVAIAIVVAHRRRLAAPALSLIAVPVGVYCVVYFPYWLAYGPDILGFVRLQGHMLARQLGTVSPNPLASSPWTWPPMLHPLRAFPSAMGSVPPTAPRIETVGNPVLWWGFLASLPLVAVSAIRRRDLAARVAVAGYVSLWMPWLLFGRTEYFYYMTPAVPFMALAVVSAIRSMPSHGARVGRGVAAAAVVSAAAFAPVWLGLAVPAWWFRAIAWLPGWR
jgi:dolichyl-phosphate-mannose-protein mannosyltransferase